MTQQEFEAKNPLDLAKQGQEFDLMGYLEGNMDEISSLDLGARASFDITEECHDIMSPKVVGFYNNYLLVDIEAMKADKEAQEDQSAKQDHKKPDYYYFLNVKRLSNYVFEARRNLIHKSVNLSKNAEEVELEIIAINEKGQTTKPIKLKGSVKKSPMDFSDKLYGYGNFVDVFKSWQFKQVFDNIYRTAEIPEYFNYAATGYIKEFGVWLMENALIDLKTGEVHTKEGVANE